MCALLDLHTQAHLCTQEGSCENSSVILFATDCVVACCHDTVCLIVRIIKTSLKDFFLGFMLCLVRWGPLYPHVLSF